MKDFLNSIHRFFLKKGDNVVIPLFRFSYCLTIFGIYIMRGWLVKKEYYTNYVPIESFRIFGISQLSPTITSVLYYGFLLFLVLAAFGLFTRLSLFISASSFFLLVGDKLSIEYCELFEDGTSHSQNLIFYLLVTMIFLPSITNFNFRDILYKTKVKMSFYWEEVLVILVICSCYFGAGYTKLIESGIEWANGESLRAYLVNRKILENIIYPDFFLENIFFLKMSSLTTLLLELIFVFGLLYQKLRWPVLTMIVGFHLSIYYLLHINFLKTHLIFIVFFLGPVTLNVFKKKIFKSYQ